MKLKTSKANVKFGKPGHVRVNGRIILIWIFTKKGAHWTQLAQDWLQWWDSVDKVLNLGVP